MTDTSRSPAELRSMFGANLRRLSDSYPTVSALCRELGINRTQFNRYLSGESFPRPEVLDRICRFFQVDARILLVPLDQIEPALGHPATTVLDGFLAPNHEQTLPPGFYHAEEAHPEDPQITRHRLLLLRRVGHTTLLRSFEPRTLLPHCSTQDREVQGFVSSNGSQIYALLARRGARDSQMMVLSASADGIEWNGQIIDLYGPLSTPKRLTLRLNDTTKATLRLARAAPYAPD
ncbi:helix-turn-helix transcriptional regulator [Ruegeria sp.]|uniref:helix-turn-helix domain-containing protein n=1 Tax=Ruegeria sp. TaxID=1879320 RepID=UPI00231AA3FE|nr:helix-turn-helix transcriptional regulator [Ruegeria sp.]MDA7966971.1 helix-turn-helix transcriptional regulator [Ruegeria sp.]